MLVLLLSRQLRWLHIERAHSAYIDEPSINRMLCNESRMLNDCGLSMIPSYLLRVDYL
jgi:hypothetical protein